MDNDPAMTPKGTKYGFCYQEKPALMKRHIGAVLKKLAEKNPLDQISIQDIAEAGRISRKTFYYHFKDKQDLVVWIFRTELAEALVPWVSTVKLQTRDDIGDSCFDLPYFPDLASGDREKAFGTYTKCLRGYLLDNKSFYLNVFSSTSQNNLKNYFVESIYPYMLNGIEQLAGNEYILDVEKRTLAGMFTEAYAGGIIRWVVTGMKTTPITLTIEENIYPISLLAMEAAVKHLIERHRERDGARIAGMNGRPPDRRA